MFNVKSVTNFRKTMETGVDPHLQVSFVLSGV